MAITAGQLIKYLSENDPNEIIIGQFITAEDLTTDEKVPSQEIMAKLSKDYDNITGDTIQILLDRISELNERGN